MLRDWGQRLVLAALLVGLFAWLRADIERLDARVDARLIRIEERLARIEERLARIEERLSDLTERVAHIEGRLSIGGAPLAATDKD